jgi:hypothetical protein
MLLVVTRPVALRGVGAAELMGSDEIYITVLGEDDADLSSTVNLNESYVSLINSNLVSPI